MNNLSYKGQEIDINERGIFECRVFNESVTASSMAEMKKKIDSLLGGTHVDCYAQEHGYGSDTDKIYPGKVTSKKVESGSYGSTYHYYRVTTNKSSKKLDTSQIFMKNAENDKTYEEYKKCLETIEEYETKAAGLRKKFKPFTIPELDKALGLPEAKESD